MVINFSKRRFGSTLIEILVVIGIIGILAVALLPMVLEAPSKARDTQRIEDANKIANFMLDQYSRGESLPTQWQFIRSDYVNPPRDIIVGLINQNLETFGGNFPEDPDSNNCFWDNPSYCGGYFYGSYTFLAAWDEILFSVAVLVENKENGNYSDPFWAPQNGQQAADSGDFYIVVIGK